MISKHRVISIIKKLPFKDVLYNDMHISLSDISLETYHIVKGRLWIVVTLKNEAYSINYFDLSIYLDLIM